MFHIFLFVKIDNNEYYDETRWIIIFEYTNLRTKKLTVVIHKTKQKPYESNFSCSFIPGHIFYATCILNQETLNIIL